MAPISPGGGRPPVKRSKNQTQTTKHHRFEGFSSRIARLKIDPIHRIPRKVKGTSTNDLATSHFRESLESWNDLNLTTNYTEFSRKVLPLCETLPQLLYHADSIAALLLEYIGRRDVLSLESLLSLLSHFAHDLGVGFEKYFSASVSLVADVAATHTSPEAIEWCFTCLAWIFKFLSRLLVPDLRPLLSIMIEYLGKSHQKDYVTRFAAESMTFLIRKAAVIYQKKEEPLQTALFYLLLSLVDTTNERDLESYKAGLMALISETINGVNDTVHECAPSIICCLFTFISSRPTTSSSAQEVVIGIWTNALRHTTAEESGPLINLLCREAENAGNPTKASITELIVSLALVSVATTKGSRIKHWTSFNEMLLKLGSATFLRPSASVDTRRAITTSLVLSVTYSPLEAVFPLLQPLGKILLSEAPAENTSLFFSLLNRLSPERMTQFFAKTLQQFVSQEWQQREDLVLVLLLGTQQDAAASTLAKGSLVSIPSEWKSKISRQLQVLEDEEDSASISLAYISLAQKSRQDANWSAEVRHLLFKNIENTLQQQSLSSRGARLTMGKGLEAFVELTDDVLKSNDNIFSQLSQFALIARYFPAFWDALLKYFQSAQDSKLLDRENAADIRAILVENLLSDDVPLKRSSLQILKFVPGPVSDDEQAIDVAIQILDTPYNPLSERQVSKLVRDLGSLWSSKEEMTPSDKLVPYFMLGLLSQKSPKLHTEISRSLEAISSSLLGEAIISEIISKWLRVDCETEENAGVERSEEQTQPRQFLTPFQDPSLERVSKLTQDESAKFVIPVAKLRKDFERCHRFIVREKGDARSLAIIILKAIPAVAEKRSRQIVPLFLSSINFDSPSDWSSPSDSSSTSATLSVHDKVQNWTKRDRRAMLELFSKFQNPKVLFRAADVYNAVLDVLARGDSEMQKLALKVISTFKDPNIRPYEEHLQNLTDDKRLRDELTVFFHNDAETSIIEQSHRENLISVVLRLLYGQMINRSGSKSSHGDQESRRKLILRTVQRLEETEIRAFIVIGCGPLADIRITSHGSGESHLFARDIVPTTQQNGFMNMSESLLATLQGQSKPFASLLQNAIIYCLVRACRKIYHRHNEVPEGADSLSRRIRKTAIDCIDLLFTHCPEVQWDEFLPVLFKEAIDPRIENFPIETAQGKSGMLRLFGTWASKLETIPLLASYNEALLPAIFSCLITHSVREEVKIFVLSNILGPLCDNIPQTDVDASKTILQPHISILLNAFDTILRSNPSRTLQDATILALSKVTPFVTSSEDSVKLLRPLTLILRQPSEKVSPHTKSNLLDALHHLLRINPLSPLEESYEELLTAIEPLFNYFKDRLNRERLVGVYQLLTLKDERRKHAADICGDLNAYATDRLDEFDYDRRLQAFNNLLQDGVAVFDFSQWSPILSNLLFFAREEDDFAIRSNAVTVLKIFIQQSCSDKDMASLRRGNLYRGLKKGLRDSNELIIADHVALLGAIVQYDSDFTEAHDMHGLLANNDEEASFFTNVMHIQQHRRLRSLRRLETEVKSGAITSLNITTIFLPLLEHFIFEPDEDPTAQNLSGQAISTIGVCLESAEWGQFKAIFRRYKSYMKSKPDLEKSVIRLISAATDSLYRSAVTMSPDCSETTEGIKPSRETHSKLGQTLPKQEKLHDDLVTDFIPDLTNFVHRKEESEISLRTPIAIAAVRLMKILPDEKMSLLLPSVLLDVCNILKSRVQESRDVARRTLAQIGSILGAPCVGYILKELRTSLPRGYQLHVLSFTVHSLLVSMTELIKPGSLDYCLPSMVAVIMDDIFGTVGQEKDAEEYISKMREVKSSKSYDSMDLLASISTVGHLVQLVRPIQALLSENITAKQAKQIDELLRRISVGLSRNPLAADRDVLVFSYEIVQEFYRQSQPKKIEPKSIREQNANRFLVDLQNRRDKKPRQSQSVFAYKVVRFSLDLLRSVLSKHPELLTPENVHGFLPVIGDAIVDGQEDVRTSAMRLLASIIRLPLAELDQNGAIYALQAVRVIRDSVNTNTECAQAALKLVTAIIKDRRDVQIRDSDLAYLLQRIAPDLDEPDKQGVTFNFVKAVMARKIAVAEIYDLVDQIGVMMVTNQTRSTRDAARGVYVHFLLDYPQSKGRWVKQVKFLARNLDYQYPEGRQSVMESIHSLLTKVGADIVQELVGSFFVPVLLILANDDSSQCREMAAALLGQLFSKAEAEQVKSFLSSLRSWGEQAENPTLAKAGMQAYKVYFDANVPGAKKEVGFIRSKIENLLAKDEGDAEDDSWEPTYHALQLLSKLSVIHPENIMSKAQTGLWQHIHRMLDHWHQWVQHSASKLIGSLFHDMGRNNAEKGLQSIPLANTHGLELTAVDMASLLKSKLRILRSPQTGEDLRLQTVRNLVFLGRCFAVNSVTIDTKTSSQSHRNDNTMEMNGADLDEDSSSHSSEEASSSRPQRLPAAKYLLTGLATVIRREPPSLQSQYLHPKLAALTLLAALLPHFPTTLLTTAATSNLTTNALTSLLSPLLHLTSSNLPPPRTPNSTYLTLHNQLLTSCTELLDLIQQKLGSQLYVSEVARAQKAMRERREERGRKRRIERVKDPEAAAREKRRRREGEKRRRKERIGENMGRRRGY